jgi:hypothetical protein
MANSPTSDGRYMSLKLDHIADEDFCYLTTTGRVSGQPRTIKIWFLATMLLRVD